MKIRLLLTGSLFLSALTGSYAQPDTAKISRRALFFADSLVKADKFEEWSIYADLAPASVIKYYGGKEGYIDHARVGRMRTLSTIEEEAPQLQLLRLVTKDDQWQCVIRESRYFHKEDKQYHLVTYFVGHSRDEGETWRLFDVSYNPLRDLIRIFPEILDMPIEEPAILSAGEEAARQQPAASPGTTQRRRKTTG